LPPLPPAVGREETGARGRDGRALKVSAPLNDNKKTVFLVIYCKGVSMKGISHAAGVWKSSSICEMYKMVSRSLHTISNVFWTVKASEKVCHLLIDHLLSPV